MSVNAKRAVGTFVVAAAVVAAIASTWGCT